MCQYAAFIAAAALLLLMPGPTNTLLVARGALLGFQRAISGVLAEMAGYAVTISMLRIILSPIFANIPLVRGFAQSACAAYLIFLSCRLWMEASKDHADVVSRRQLFIATMTNPKALVFTFSILPTPATNVMMAFIINGSTLLALIALAGIFWTSIGAVIGAGASINPGSATSRIASCVLASFALYMLFSAAAAIVAAHWQV